MRRPGGGTDDGRRSIAGLQRSQGTLLEIVQSGDPQRYHEINEEFHALIYAGAHNPYLADLTLATRARIAPFSRAQFRNFGRLAKSHEEHAHIIAAILARDYARASSVMRTHIGSVYDAYAGYRCGLSEIGAPSAELGDIARPRNTFALRPESLSRAAVVKPDRADREWRRHRRDERAEGVRGQCPSL